MVKNWVKDWLGINSDSETFVSKKELRGLLEKELVIVFEETVSGNAAGVRLGSIFPKVVRKGLFSRVKAYTGEEATRVARTYVDGLSSGVFEKVNSEQFLDEIVQRINNKQVG